MFRASVFVGLLLFVLSLGGVAFVQNNLTRTQGIADKAVTLRKIQDFTNAKFPCRSTAGSGSLEQCSFGSGLALSGGVLNVTGGGGSVTSVAATAPIAGFTISGSPITTSGTLTFALADDLAALEGLSGIGYPKRTASNTWSIGNVSTSDITGLATVATSGSASDLSTGTLNSAQLANSGVTAGSCGGATQSCVLTYDEKGRITAASTATISGGSSTFDPNNPPASANALDDEFTGTAGTLSGWTTVSGSNFAFATNAVNGYKGFSMLPSQGGAGGTQFAAILKSVGSGSAKTFFAQLTPIYVSAFYAMRYGIVLAAGTSSTSAVALFGVELNPSSVSRIVSASASNFDGASFSSQSIDWPNINYGAPLYYAVGWDGATNVKFYISQNGIGWSPALSITLGFTPAAVGIGVQSNWSAGINPNGTIGFSSMFFRARDITSSPTMVLLGK